MILIAAVNNNWGIGKDNDLLYHIPEDMKFFRSKTKENLIIVGRKTLESFPGGEPLKNRINIVITRNKDYDAKGGIVCTDVKELKNSLKPYTDKEVYICGGEQIYKQFLPYCHTALITKVYDDKACEKYMPNLDEIDNWVLSEKSEDYTDNGLSFCFCTYTNNSPKNL